MIAFPATIDAATGTAGDAAGNTTVDTTGTALAPAPTPSPTAFLDDTERLGDEIARLAAHLHAATYQLLVLIRDFDEREGWGGGFLSCAHWLSWRTGISPGPAREKVRVARALASLPLISGAMAQGQLSFSKVRALSRVATPENERELLEIGRHGTAAHIEKLVRAWRRVDRIEEAQEEELRHQSRFLHLYPDHDGSYVLRGRLDPEVGALLEKALKWASEELYREAEAAAADTSFEQRRADALGLVAEQAMAERGMATSKEIEEGQAAEEDDSSHEPSRTLSRADRFQVVLHVDSEGLRRGAGASDAPGEEAGSPMGQAVLADSGVGVPAATSRRLACDASVVVMTHDEEGRGLDVGRKRRTVPPAIRRALDHRDKGCRFPGCGCRYVEAHHITHWADGGETKLENLTLVCRVHHRAIHEEGFRVELVGKGEEIRFFRPDGRPIPTAPEAPPLPAEPVAEMVRAHSEEGIEPDAWTATPLWYGEPFDLGLAIDMLRPRGATRSR